MRSRLMVSLAAVCLTAAAADVVDTSRETRSFRDVREVLVDNVSGTVHVKASADNTATIEIERRIRAESDDRMEAAKREVKLETAANGGRLKVLEDGPFRCNCGDWGMRRQGYHVTYNLTLTMPATAPFDIRTVNGELTLDGLAAPGKASTVNGPIKAAFAKNPAGPLSMETINGDVDVTLHEGLAADLRMKTMNGGMFTDFDVTPLPSEPATMEKRGGKYIYRTQDAARVRVGAGGPEFSLKTLNGSIYVRSRK